MAPDNRGDPTVTTHIHATDIVFDHRDAKLLRAIGTTGSLNAAANKLGRSYSRAHARLQELETAFDTLVDRQRGGPDGGGSTLTQAGEALLARFDRLHAALTGHADAEETVFTGDITGREGDMATVATAAGPLRAIVPGEARTVVVGVRADAVTVHTPDAAPAADATSARNQFDGTITSIDAGNGIALVTIDVGATGSLTALLTEHSVTTLGLEPGTPVVASFKATATRGTPAPDTAATDR